MAEQYRDTAHFSLPRAAHHVMAYGGLLLAASRARNA